MLFMAELAEPCLTEGTAAESPLQAAAGEVDKSQEEEEKVVGVMMVEMVLGVVDNEEEAEVDKNYEVFEEYTVEEVVVMVKVEKEKLAEVVHN